MGDRAGSRYATPSGSVPAGPRRPGAERSARRQRQHGAGDERGRSRLERPSANPSIGVESGRELEGMRSPPRCGTCRARRGPRRGRSRSNAGARTPGPATRRRAARARRPTGPATRFRSGQRRIVAELAESVQRVPARHVPREHGLLDSLRRQAGRLVLIEPRLRIAAGPWHPTHRFCRMRAAPIRPGDADGSGMSGPVGDSRTRRPRPRRRRAPTLSVSTPGVPRSRPGSNDRKRPACTAYWTAVFMSVWISAAVSARL